MPTKTKAAYQVRNDTGRIRTVTASSYRGAAKVFVAKYKTRPGEDLDIKLRGAPSSEWQRYRVY